MLKVPYKNSIIYQNIYINKIYNGGTKTLLTFICLIWLPHYEALTTNTKKYKMTKTSLPELENCKQLEVLKILRGARGEGCTAAHQFAGGRHATFQADSGPPTHGVTRRSRG